MTYGNLFYFKSINGIGGTEQFLYEMAKKYSDYNLVVMYDEIDKDQYKRLSKLVKCIRHIKGTKVTCKRAFFNFNIDAIDDIISTEDYYCFIAHAIYQEIGYKPPLLHPKLNHYLGVSEYASRKLKEYATLLKKDIEVVTCYNPLTMEPKEKVINLVSATRLDNTKGGKRILKLIDALDKYAIENNRHYVWHIFTNSPPIITSPNVVLMKPRVDVRPYIASADYVVQLSDDMETYCYTINEAWAYGVRVVRCPFSVCKEFKLNDDMELVLDYDTSNVDYIAKRIFEDEYKPFKYELVKDNWIDHLVLDKTDYKEVRKMKCRIKCTSTFYDLESKCDRKVGEEWIVDRERADYLTEERNLCSLVEVIKEVKEDKKKPTPKKEKATK